MKMLKDTTLSDKLSGDSQIFQVWPFFNSLIIKNLPFSQQEHVQIFPLSSPSKTCTLPFNFALVRDPKNIFYYQRDVRIMRVSAYLCLWVYLTFFCSSRFHWQNRLFPENCFSEELALLPSASQDFPNVKKQPLPEWRCTWKDKLWRKVASEYQILKSPFF